MNRSDAPSLMSRLRSAIQTLGKTTGGGGLVQTSGIKSGKPFLGVTYLKEYSVFTSSAKKSGGSCSTHKVSSMIRASAAQTSRVDR